MFCRNLLAGLVGALTLATVAVLQPRCVQADDRMQLGAPFGLAAEFQTEVGDRVFFSDASADLGTRGRIALEAQAAWLLRNSGLSVTIEGHADDAGSPAHNQEVSQRRAEVVRRRLVQMGVAAERIRIVAYGRERLIADCAAAVCSAQNRRAVTVIGPPPDTAAAGGARGPSALDDPWVRRPPRRLN